MNTIWSNLELNYEDWKDFLDEEYPESSQEEKYNLMWEINDEYLDDARINYNIHLSEDIVVIGDIGLWNGRFQGYRLIKTRNISDCFYSDCDYCIWYQLRCLCS